MLKITDARHSVEPQAIAAKLIPEGTVFTGKAAWADAPTHVWIRTMCAVVCLDAVGASYTTSAQNLNIIFYNYKPREAELILK